MAITHEIIFIYLLSMCFLLLLQWSNRPIVPTPLYKIIISLGRKNTDWL